MSEPARAELVTRAAGLHMRAMRADKREADFIASTDAIDSYDEVVNQSWNLTRYNANPVVLFAHNQRELPIGMCTVCEVRDGALQCTIKFASAEANPKADQVWKLVQEGMLRAVSVGFNPGTMRLEKRNGREVFVLADNDLMEISVVPVPANPEALAKMRARAAADAHSAATSSEEKQTMNEEAEKLRALVTKREEEVRAAEKTAADLKVRADALETQNTRLVAERDAAVNESKDAKEKLDRLSDKLIENEVAALVGVKIEASAKENMIELAKSNRPLFEKFVAQLSLLPTAGRVMTPAVDNTNSATEGALNGSAAIVAEIEKMSASEAASGAVDVGVDLGSVA